MNRGRGLTDIATATLEQIYNEVSAGRLSCPLSASALHMCRSEVAEAIAEVTASLDAASVKAVLAAAVAERRSQHGPDVELVWTGPDTRASVGRDTRVVLRQLFAGARDEVLVVGYCFDHGERILAPLHGAMRARRALQHRA